MQLATKSISIHSLHQFPIRIETTRIHHAAGVTAAFGKGFMLKHRFIMQYVKNSHALTCNKVHYRILGPAGVIPASSQLVVTTNLEASTHPRFIQAHPGCGTCIKHALWSNSRIPRPSRSLAEHASPTTPLPHVIQCRSAVTVHPAPSPCFTSRACCLADMTCCLPSCSPHAGTMYVLRSFDGHFCSHPAP